MTAPRRILVIATRRIGDVLLVTPLIRSLRLAWPNAKLEVLVFDSTRGILANNPDIDRIITVPERPRLGEHLSLLAKLWRRYDLAISTLPGDRPTLYAWLAGKRRIGLLSPAADQAWKRRLLDAWTPFDNETTHTVRMYLALADLLGIERQHEVVLAWSRAQADRVKELLLSVAPSPQPSPVKGEGVNQPYAVLHVYPKFGYKTWHRPGWADLARWLESRSIRTVLTGSSAPDELAYIAELLPDLPASTVNLAGQLDFGEVACLLAGASIYVGPDTAVTHIAAASGVPTVALFGPSNPVKWGPWPKGFGGPGNPFSLKGTQRAGNVVLMQGEGECVPCFQEGCQRHVNSLSDCLQQLASGRIIEAAQGLLEEKQP
ncbi:MAG: glycosyltransferase family 9 protein [Sulfuricella sp.]|nr:glycosyltransferase family 9 protein [Sulfuricella sp.]